MGLNTDASAALVYLILYTILFAFLLFGYVTGRLRLRSPYTVILFHVTIRLATQSTGLAYGVVGHANTSLVTAYFVLGNEGYFTLVFCTYGFLISWQNHNFASHDSWLSPRFLPGTPWYKRLICSFTIIGPSRRPMAVMYNLLIAANALIASGGSLLAEEHNSASQFNWNLTTAKATRMTGQLVLLGINIFLLYCIVDTIRQSRRENPGRGTHPTLLIFLVICPLLLIRGLYGVMSCAIPVFNSFDLNNYGETGIITSFVINEYIMGTTMEWTSCALLMATYITSRNDPQKADSEMYKCKEAQSGEAIEV